MNIKIDTQNSLGHSNFFFYQKNKNLKNHDDIVSKLTKLKAYK